MPGTFITFEGGEGAGKSTQIRKLSERLKELHFDVVFTREPGGSAGAEILRHVLLNGAAEPFGAKTEVMLFAAARLDHMSETILPALERGAIVLCDRFSDSTRAYQGGEDGVDDQFLNALERVSVGENKPDLTLILDIDPDLGLERVTRRLATQSEDAKNLISHIDRFEKDDLAVHHKRRNAFLKIAKNEPDRCVVIDASQDEDIVGEVIWTCVEERLHMSNKARRRELTS